MMYTLRVELSESEVEMLRAHSKAPLADLAPYAVRIEWGVRKSPDPYVRPFGTVINFIAPRVSVVGDDDLANDVADKILEHLGAMFRDRVRFPL